jgi:hypothetical protein
MRVLITAGPVYSALDDNKLVSNRSRGLWAIQLAQFLRDRGHHVILVVPKAGEVEGKLKKPAQPVTGTITVLHHDGYQDYVRICLKETRECDWAVMAAAVVNWIPSTTIQGKMPTEGFKEGDEINVKFFLAPRVIDMIRRGNDKCHVIGCKMTSGASGEVLLHHARQTMAGARASAVVANDLQDLKTKLVVYPDGAVVPFGLGTQGIEFTHHLVKLIEDVHYTTSSFQMECIGLPGFKEASEIFDRIVNRYRHRFTGPEGKVFGSLAVRVSPGLYLVSPREKGMAFTSLDAVLVDGWDGTRRVQTVNGKATLNAPLLTGMLGVHTRAAAVLHLHEAFPDGPVVPYAPPGTVRDTDRDLSRPYFTIEHHGFIACVNEYGDFIEK